MDFFHVFFWGWDRWYIITVLADFLPLKKTRYILILTSFGGYIIPTTYQQNQNNPLIIFLQMKVQVTGMELVLGTRNTPWIDCVEHIPCMIFMDPGLAGL